MKTSFSRFAILAGILIACAYAGVADVVTSTFSTLFNDHVEIRFSNVQGGTNKSADFPVLVTIDPKRMSGFSYSRIDKLGKDFRFVFSGTTNKNDFAIMCP